MKELVKVQRKPGLCLSYCFLCKFYIAANGELHGSQLILSLHVFVLISIEYFVLLSELMDFLPEKTKITNILNQKKLKVLNIYILVYLLILSHVAL